MASCARRGDGDGEPARICQELGGLLIAGAAFTRISQEAAAFCRRAGPRIGDP
jgi:hypothetical protein